MMPKENILVVEDEEDIQELIQFNLAKESYRVTCAGKRSGLLWSAGLECQHGSVAPRVSAGCIWRLRF